ncbi:MAG TPA: hypothetical protein VFF30_20285 [Nitrososphaerales archaeon]|nr:hypothetical protein [Nitrososphaerales archaeon]
MRYKDCRFVVCIGSSQSLVPPGFHYFAIKYTYAKVVFLNTLEPRALLLDAEQSLMLLVQPSPHLLEMCLNQPAGIVLIPIGKGRKDRSS